MSLTSASASMQALTLGPASIGVLLLVQKESIPTVEKKWLRKNIFRSTGTIHGQNCTVVIDGGSCENIISQTLVDRLKLKVYKHNHSYFVK